MNAGNGYDNHRLDVVEADARDLRQLMMLEFRALRAELKHSHEELKHIKELGQHNARALDILLARAELDEKDDG